MFLTTLLLILAAGLFIWSPVANWWNDRQDREAEIAELEAAARHTRPVLIRSRYIGDPDVEDAYYRLKENIRRAGKIFITPDDIHLEIYRTRTQNATMFIEFQDWVDLVESEHRKRVNAWETNMETTMKTDKGEIGLNQQGRRAFNGQKDPKKRTYIFDINN
jgi:hypothetical protein